MSLDYPDINIGDTYTYYDGDRGCRNSILIVNKTHDDDFIVQIIANENCPYLKVMEWRDILKWGQLVHAPGSTKGIEAMEAELAADDPNRPF
jgi:hypothetical protein